MKKYEVIFDINEDDSWETTSLFLVLDPNAKESLDTQAYRYIFSICQKSGIIFRSDTIEVIDED
jgi:hypothetical protein